jgi:hypothetical protein
MREFRYTITLRFATNTAREARYYAEKMKRLAAPYCVGVRMEKEKMEEVIGNILLADVYEKKG